MLNCPECGLTITDTQEECPKCHKKVEIETAEEETVQVASKNAKKGKKSKGNKNAPAKPASSKEIKEEMIAAVEAAEASLDVSDASATAQEELIAAVVEAEALAAMEEEALAPEEIELACKVCMTAYTLEQNFCASCGNSVGTLEQVETPVIPKTDAESNRLVAALGYVCFFFPILFGFYRKSSFAKFHTKQATVLFFFSLLTLFVLVGLRNAVDQAFIGGIGLGYRLIPNFDDPSWHHGHGFTGGILYFYLTWVIYALHFTPFAMMIIGMVNALRRKKNRLPLIGRFTTSTPVSEDNDEGVM